MKVILDTSVIISMFATSGSTLSKSIITLAIKKKITLVRSKETYEELKQVISQGTFKKLPGWQERKVARFIAWYKYNCIVEDTHGVLVNVQLRDPSDIIFLQLAVKAKADALVTLDKDFLSLNWGYQTEIIRPEELIHKIRVG
ncbi:MAG: putative toxin-antitoxin system toxin component, PIN family [Candidatus Dojkabacteria bacterium]